MTNDSQQGRTSSVCPPYLQINDEPLEKSLLPNSEIAPDPELVSQGWERRFMADPVREKESLDLYRELGFEVRSVPIKPSELSEACGDCRVAVCQAYTTIYTRKV
ncbi:MAG: hypothetical protein FVQ83_14330 [Chloroflexi bacterium]|nr:hypothetical protein [Chloroflexota bacterium]